MISIYRNILKADIDIRKVKMIPALPLTSRLPWSLLSPRHTSILVERHGDIKSITHCTKFFKGDLSIAISIGMYNCLVNYLL